MEYNIRGAKVKVTFAALRIDFSCILLLSCLEKTITYVLCMNLVLNPDIYADIKIQNITGIAMVVNPDKLSIVSSEY